MSNTFEARLISITNNEVYRIIGNTERGALLRAVFNWEKIGGLKDWELTVNRDTVLPFYSGMRIDFYFVDEIFLTSKLIFSGYSELIPTQEGDFNKITLKGKGFYWKLGERVHNKAYTNTPIANIINDLDFSGLDLDPDEFDIRPPSISVTIDFRDKTYIQIFDTLLKIANTDYDNNQYIYGVNEKRGVYFYSLDPEIKDKLFEDYDFQNPSVDFLDDVINSVKIFRAQELNPKETELVGTFENTDSSGKYGKKEKKITFSDYIDNNSIDNIANFILEKNADPSKIIKINNFYRKDAEIVEGGLVFEETLGVLDNWVWFDQDGFSEAVYRNSSLNIEAFNRILDPGYYGVSTKKQIKNTLVNECDSLSGWVVSAVSSVVDIFDGNVLTGRNVIRWTRTSNQFAGDYIEFTPTDIISGLINLKISVYFKDNVSNITLQIFDTEDNMYSYEIGDYNQSFINSWLRIELPLDPCDEFGLMRVKSGTGLRFLKVVSGVEERPLGIHYSCPGVRNLKKIKLILDTGNTNPDEIYIDRIEVRNKSWGYSELTLDKAVYEIERNYILGALEFGEKAINLIDEIKDNVAKGDLAFDMYAKE